MALLVLASLAGAAGFGYTQYCSSASTRVFGVVVDPWAGWDAWTQEAGFAPTTPAQFEHWSKNRTLDSHFAEARRKGLRSYFVTWEPWEPKPFGVSLEEQARQQNEWSAETILSGKHDEYIRTFANSVKFSRLTVYIRFAHEMNGHWYPWSQNPDAYREVWKYVHSVFEEEGVKNAKFIFSVNLNLFEEEGTWKRNLLKCWPGEDYVDFVGASFIGYDLADVRGRLDWMNMYFDLPLVLTEVNTFEDEGAALFEAMEALIMEEGWLEGIVLSQAPSRSDKRLEWSVLNDPETLIVLSRITDYLSPPAVCRLF